MAVTKEQRALAVRLLTEQKTDPLKFYRPNPIQALMHKCIEKRVLILTGNGAGKTHCGAHEFSAAMLGRHWVTMKCDRCGGEGHIDGERCGLCNSSGKINKYPNPPLEGRIASEKETITKKIVPLLHALLDPYLAKGYPKKLGTSIECEWKLINGSSFDIKSTEADAKNFASVDLDIMWFDEPFSEAIWLETVPRMRKGKGGRIIITMTPLFEASWMCDKWVNEDCTDTEENFKIIYGSKWDNCKCLKAEKHDNDKDRPIDYYGHCCCNGGYVHKEAILAEIAEYDETQMDARVEGHFITLRDRVFTQFDPEVHILPVDLTPSEVFRKEMQLYVAVDPHRRKPPAWILFGIDPDDIVYILDEFPNINHGYYKTPHGVAPRFYDMINEVHLGYDESVIEFDKIEKYWGGNVHKRFMDPRFGHDTLPNTNERIIDAYKRHAREQGISMKFLPAIVGTDSKVGEIDSGIALIRQKLIYDSTQDLSPSNMPGLFINPRCANVIRMFNHFKYTTQRGRAAEGKGASDIFESKFKDFADAVRYGIKSAKYRTVHKNTEYVYKPRCRLTGW